MKQLTITLSKDDLIKICVMASGYLEKTTDKKADMTTSYMRFQAALMNALKAAIEEEQKK